MRNCDRAKELSFNEMCAALHKLYQESESFRWELESHGFSCIYLQDGLYMLQGMTGEYVLVKAGSPMEACEIAFKRMVDFCEA